MSFKFHLTRLAARSHTLMRPSSVTVARRFVFPEQKAGVRIPS